MRIRKVGNAVDERIAAVTGIALLWNLADDSAMPNVVATHSDRSCCFLIGGLLIGGRNPR
jgi:hypothetical protein